MHLLSHPLTVPLKLASSESAQTALSAAGKVQPNESKSWKELQNLMGTRVVFISAAEPAYLVTEDERRIAIGDDVADDVELAGVTTHQLILKKSGGLKVINLPDPVVQ